MAPLPRELRRLLENVIVAARDAAEDAARAALRALSVDREEAHSGISDDDRALRVALRARARQLGEFDLLVGEVAYGQWHRMLFARFLAENDLLMHPSGVAVSLAECADLAPAEGEADEWMLAARYAGEMLPGIFRLDDPSTRVRFARNDVSTLEKLLVSLPAETFHSDDALGWVYQYWQSRRKNEVNASERKIGGADLPPVTQLFTEDYMVAFLLDNSLGAWWATRNPDSPLNSEFEFLRRSEDGNCAAGGYEAWPDAVSAITVLDPFCGSGHFLVAAATLLCKMRQERDGLSAPEAIDAVLRDNIYGLEIDGRCVQIAVFALALVAWKRGGYRELPVMNIACTGVPARGTEADWRRLGDGDARLEEALARLYFLFKDADTVGSLIDPQAVIGAESLLSASWTEVEPLLHAALAQFGGDDPAQRVFRDAAHDVAKAARLMSGSYSLVATNVPYLTQQRQSERLREYGSAYFPQAKAELATMSIARSLQMTAEGASVAVVSPTGWFFLPGYKKFRKDLLGTRSWNIVARLGTGAFTGISGEVVNVSLTVLSSTPIRADFAAVDAQEGPGALGKAVALRESELLTFSRAAQLANPDSRIVLEALPDFPLLSTSCQSRTGTRTADNPRFLRNFWELPHLGDVWEYFQSTVKQSTEYGGRELVIRWDQGAGDLAEYARLGLASIQGMAAWGKRGVCVSLMGQLRSTLYAGDRYDMNCGVLWPLNGDDLPALWCFCKSDELNREVRRIDQQLKLTTATLTKIPFDIERWSKVAAKEYPDGLPDPSSEDPTQWLFDGRIPSAQRPLHVAVARLLGFEWPEAIADDVAKYADDDGIVCIPAVAGERSAVDRLRELLIGSFGADWSESRLDQLLREEGVQDLEVWLKESFFDWHAKLFGNRPFIWHIWDGRKDGFSALVNYHKLDKATLEKLTFSTLQWWIDRQRSEVAADLDGAEPRLAAAVALQAKLAQIIEGEPPYDIFVRWKPLARQAIGWNPDLNDGVRVNIRPFVMTAVLRSKLSVHWNKDRGKNADGSERHNDLHFTIAEKLAAGGGQ